MTQYLYKLCPPTRRQIKRDNQKHHLFAPTASCMTWCAQTCSFQAVFGLSIRILAILLWHSLISSKLCMMIEDVETVLKGGNHFSIQRIVFHRCENADFWPLTHRVNLIPSGCHGNLQVITFELTQLA